MTNNQGVQPKAASVEDMKAAAARLRSLLTAHDTAVERYSKPEANARMVVLRSDLATVLDHVDEDWFGEWQAACSARIKDRDEKIPGVDFGVCGSCYPTGHRVGRVCDHLPSPAPEPPWPVGPATNCKRIGWEAFFVGRGREKCPFPPARADLQRDYREGWDLASQTAGSTQ
jgi:hypothetical protein